MVKKRKSTEKDILKDTKKLLKETDRVVASVARKSHARHKAKAKKAGEKSALKKSRKDETIKSIPRKKSGRKKAESARGKIQPNLMQKKKPRKAVHKYRIRVREEKVHGKAKKGKERKGLQKISMIPSGISGMDKLIGGGVQKGSVMLFVGGAGSGKTVFATQFLVEGAKRGEPGVFITFEEKKARFYLEMKALGWNLAELEKKKLFTFIEYTPEQVKKMLEEGGGEIEVAIEEVKAKRIVIDSISSFALLFESELVKREAALSLFELLRKWDVTTLLTLEDEPIAGMATEHISSPIEFEVDGIILLYFARTSSGRVRGLEVLKMRGVQHARQIYGFEIGRGGVRISSRVVHLK